nr:heavy metal translocating P-type ATPase [uncultured Faecalimonas sp.]
MKFKIKHEIEGRIRVHFPGRTMTYRQADTLLYYLENRREVLSAKVYERTGDAVIRYEGDRRRIIEMLCSFSYEKAAVPDEVLETSGRELNASYQEKIVDKILFRWMRRWFLPYPVAALYTTAMSVKYIYHGLKVLCRRKIEVPVLDATAIGVSILRNDFDTASSIMFFLGIGELLEEWTHKKSVDDLARTMSLNVGKVWLKKDDQEILVEASEVKKGDQIVVHMGNVIPFDGIVTEGEAMVNQAALTGESVPVRRSGEDSVYAGTVVEEGEITLLVQKTRGSSRFEKIVTMIEESEKLKSALEGKAEHLADRLVPYTFVGTGLVYLLTRNITKALSVLMVDFSCAMKLAMPISVLSAIREASRYHLTVKGGKYLEAVAEAETIVFDKTGTLTKARPTVVDVISFNGEDPDELLRVAACMEEHFPHSMAKAVVHEAKKRHLEHEEMHSKVEYMVAHGISTEIEGKRAVIGSYHFVFEDEKCRIPEGKEELFESLSGEYSQLYLAMEQELAAVIRIEDPLREEAAEVIRLLKETGIRNIVMMTGDSERTAAAIAKKVGVDHYDSEVLPEDKARFVEKEKAQGKKVIMIGDGINDSPALSAADVGIAISDGAELAREIADITISADDLYELVLLKRLSDRLMQRIGRNYRLIVGINAALIAFGVAGILQPTTSALLHNASTLLIGVESMKTLLEENTRT